MKITKGQLLVRYAAIIDEDIDVLVQWVNDCVNEGWEGSPKTEKARFEHMKAFMTKRVDESTTGRIIHGLQRKAA